MPTTRETDPERNMATTYETPSAYVPAGARFVGAGAEGVEARIAAADDAGAGWTDRLAELPSDLTWNDVEAAMHYRNVDGRVVWGLSLGKIADALENWPTQDEPLRTTIGALEDAMRGEPLPEGWDADAGMIVWRDEDGAWNVSGTDDSGDYSDYAPKDDASALAVVTALGWWA